MTEDSLEQRAERFRRALENYISCRLEQRDYRGRTVPIRTMDEWTITVSKWIDEVDNLFKDIGNGNGRQD